MADILQQQAFQPQEAGSYNGIPAALPAWGGLAKALQGYMGGLQSKRAEAGQTALGVQQKADQDRSAAALAAVLNGDPVGPLDLTGMNPDDQRIATTITAQRQTAAATAQREKDKLVEQRAYDAQQPQPVDPYTYTYEGNPTMARDNENSPWHNANTPEMDAANKKLAGNYLVEGQQMGINGPIQTIATSKVIPAAGQTIIVGGKGNDKLDEIYATQIGGLLEAGDKAGQRIAASRQISELVGELNAAGGDTNALAGLKATAGSLLEGIGRKDWADKFFGNNTTDMYSAIDGLTKELMGGMIGNGPDAILPNSGFSNADREYMAKILASITDTPGAFEIKLSALRKVAERAQAYAARVSGLVNDEPGKYTLGQVLSIARKEFSVDPNSKESAFTPEERKRIDAAMARVPGAAPPGGAPPPSPAGQYPEGTIIQDAAGKRMIRTNGAWVPHG